MTKFCDFKEVSCRFHDGEVVTITPLRKEDIKAVASLYSTIAITKDNYRKLLMPGGSETFEKCGGMFQIQDELSLEKLLNNQEELMLVAHDDHKDLCGIIWYSQNEANFEALKEVRRIPDKKDYYPALETIHQNETLAYGKEIIVSKQHKIKKLPLVLFYTILSHLNKIGYTYSTGEVYQVDCFFDNEGEHASNMLNIRSYKTLSHSGGIRIGTMSPKSFTLDGYGVTITSHVFTWNIKRSLEKFGDFKDDFIVFHKTDADAVWSLMRGQKEVRLK